MSISITNLALSPNAIQIGITPVTITYKGFVTLATDNDVSLTFSICPTDTNVYLKDDTGAQVKSYTWKQSFPVGSTPGSLSKVINFVVLATPAAPVICTAKLLATTADNSDHDTDNTAFTYY